MYNENEIGVINEVGDLGLGYTPLTKSEKEMLKEKDNGKEE